MKVKICGVTRPEDAEIISDLGADYMGVVLYPKSRRYVPASDLSPLLSVKGPLKVAVMVNPSLEEALDVLRTGFDLIQLHGEERVEFARKVGIHRVIKAFRIKDTPPRIEEEWKEAHGILFDSFSPTAFGGTGKTFNWDLIKGLSADGWRIFLSGGLKPENVREACMRVKPYCADVSSGVELSPGIKDPAKVEKFIKEVKSL